MNTKNPEKIIDYLIEKAEIFEDITVRQKRLLTLLDFGGIFDDNVILTIDNEENKQTLSNIIDIFMVPFCSKFFGFDVVVFIKVKKFKSSGDVVYKDPVILEKRENYINSEFNPEMTFDTFLVGHSNKTVFAAAERVAENLGISINPLYIFGSPGLGKTHLLNAIANYVKKHEKNKKIVLTSAEGFVDDFVSSMRSNDDKFKKKYNSADVLLIDDIQFFSENMHGSMNAFFSIFEEMIKKNKQIIITADVIPNELNNFHKRMKSRLQSNIYVGIDLPETELKINYIKSVINKTIRKEKDKEDWTNEIIQLIAGISGINIRELSGFLSNIIFYCNVHNVKVSENIVYKTLNNSNFKAEKTVTFDIIVEAVGSYFNIPPKEILGALRTPNLVYARHISMYLCRKITNYTTTQIGVYFNKDHSAVIAADKKIRKLINENTQTYTDIENISNKINNK